MSEETRKKMSLAKLNRSVSKDVRKKMSAAHKGKTHTAQTSALLSEKLSGRPKSAEHRMAIAAAQRRRHAAARVLKAVEDVHRHAQAEGECVGVWGVCMGGVRASLLLSLLLGHKRNE